MTDFDRENGSNLEGVFASKKSRIIILVGLVIAIILAILDTHGIL